MPMTISALRMSSTVRNGDVCHDTQTGISLLRLPIQVSFNASIRVAVSPNSGSKAMLRIVMPIAVPSAGATL